jgi:GWxTD domain-containing protein
MLNGSFFKVKFLRRSFILLALVAAQAGSDETERGLALSLDCAQFLSSKQRPYLEIYYSLPESQISYLLNRDDGFSCQIVMALQIFHEEKPWASKVWKIEKTLKDTAAVNADLQIVDMLRYALEEPGQYRVMLHARDMNHGKVDSVVVGFEAHDFWAGKVGLSDLELASQIEKLAPDSASVFAKNTMKVVPHPGLLYGASAPRLYYYFEAYRLFQGAPGSRYKARCLVKDSNGRMVEGLVNPDRTRKKAFDSSVEIGMIDVSNLASGIYTFFYGIADSSGTLLAGREKKFYVYNPSLPLSAQTDSAGAVFSESLGPLDLLAGAELDKEFAAMQYVTNKDERKFYKNLQNLVAKREFIFSIWSRPRPSQALSGLAFRKQYLERVEEVNAHYRTAFSPGWKTDRGRVYILYGAPSSIERFANERETKPYEIWSYHNLENGVEFIFADRYGFKNFELLHSTLLGELQNPNWRDLIRIDVNPTPPTQPQ